MSFEFNLDMNTKKVDDSIKRLSKEVVNFSKGVSKSAEKGFDDAGKASETFAKKAGKGLKEVEGLASKIFGPLGISLGIGALIRQAHGLNMEILGWHNSLRSLSDATGDTTKAVNTMTRAWSGSAGSLGTIQGVMQNLGGKGLPVANKHFEHMTKWVTNLHIATGISADALSDFTVGLSQTFPISLQATKDMTSSMLALGDGFGYTAPQIEEAMRTTGKVLNSMGVFFDNVEKSMQGMTKAVGGAMAGMRAMNISAQQAGDFIGNILDPEKINENMGLFARLGISYGETMDMMISETGQETFMDKLMTNLPNLARQITSLRNPMARLQFSKSLGLPLEIAQKMAKGTNEEIQQIMTEYKEKAVEDKAAQKRQENMKMEAAKVEEQFKFLRMKALAPLMKFVGDNFPTFMRLLTGLSEVFASLLVPITKFADGLTTVFAGPLTEFVTALGEFNVKGMGAAIGSAFSNALSKHPLITSLVSGFLAYKAFVFGTQAKLAFQEARWHATGNPVRTVELGPGKGMGGKIARGAGRVLGSKVGMIGTGLAAGAGAAYLYNKTKDDNQLMQTGTGMVTAAGYQAGKFGAGAIKGGLKGGMAAAKAIPGLGAALMLAEGLAYSVHGAIKAGDALGKKKGEKVTAGERTSGAGAGLISGFSFGAFDREKMTQQFAGKGDADQYAGKGYMKRRSEDLFTGMLAGQIRLFGGGKKDKDKEATQGRVRQGFTDAKFKAERMMMTLREKGVMQIMKDGTKQITDIFKNWWAGIRKMFSDQVQKVKDWWSGITDTFNEVTQKISGWWTGIKTMFTTGVDDLKNLWNNFSFEDIALKIGMGIMGLGESLWEGLQQMFRDAVEWLKFWKDGEETKLNDSQKSALAIARAAHEGTGVYATKSAAERLKVMEGQKSVLAGSAGEKLLADRLQNMTAHIAETESNQKREKEQRAAREKREQEKRDKDRKDLGDQVGKGFGGVNANLERIGDNTEPTKQTQQQSYIDFWMKNQGFMSITFTG